MAEYRLLMSFINDVETAMKRVQKLAPIIVLVSVAAFESVLAYVYNLPAQPINFAGQLFKSAC